MTSPVFASMAPEGYEQVVFCHDRATGLRSIIAIHDTRLGPALGGTRFYPYPTESDALLDALRLARAMTYKNAAAGLNLGGGKAVIIGDPATLRSEALLRAYARFVHGLGGRYVTASDVGTNTADLDIIREETPYVTDCSPTFGGGGGTSAMTGLTIYLGMKAAARHAFGSDSLKDRRIAVQGAGKIGHAVMEHAAKEGARLIVADVDPAMVERAVREFGASPVEADEVVAADCDILSPCAMGGTINATTIPTIRAKVIAGGANNQLLDELSDARALQARGVLYAPDFLINCGGVINVGDELGVGGYNRDRSEARARRVYDTADRIFAAAAREGVTTLEAANRYAEERMEILSQVHRIYIGT